jgi:hypothetical protein
MCLYPVPILWSSVKPNAAAVGAVRFSQLSLPMLMAVCATSTQVGQQPHVDSNSMLQFVAYGWGWACLGLL